MRVPVLLAVIAAVIILALFTWGAEREICDSVIMDKSCRR
jgi:hypothetical protein